MTFYERYEKVCFSHGVDPCSQKAADMIHTTRGNISMWKKNNNIPKGDMLRAIADAYHTSTDYLVGRTDDPADFVINSTASDNTTTPAVPAGPVTPVIADPVYLKYQQLDDTDKMRAEAYIDGMLTSDKYRRKMQA